MADLMRVQLIEYVKGIRKERKVSMREVQEKTGLSIAFISEMENLKKDIGLERFLKYLDAFGLTVIIAPKKSKLAEIHEACKKLISMLKY